MTNTADTIARELRRLRSEGLSEVFLSEESIDLIQSLNQSASETSSMQRATPSKGELGVERTGPDPTLLTNSIGNRNEPGNSVALASANGNRSNNQTLPDHPEAYQLPEGSASEQLKWLQNRVKNCVTCNDHLAADGKVVFGEGLPEADIFFCGEAPGADEAISGRPFVGKAGQLLTKIISAMGLDRSQVYIANILKWRPEHDKPYGNRPPTREEMRFCLPYLISQIEIVNPKVIVALGKTAVDGLIGHDPKRKMGTIRGTFLEFNEIPVMATFHPSYLLRNGTLRTKRLVWEDLLQVMTLCNLPISERQKNYFLPK